MQFQPSDEERMVIDAVRAVAGGALRDAAAAADTVGRLPAGTLKQLADLGFFGLQAAEQSGGLGLSAQTAVQCLVAMARADASAAQLAVEHGVALSLLQDAGLPARALTAHAQGKALLALALADAAEHPDATAPGVTAEAVDSAWILQGHVGFVLGAGLASHAVIRAEADGASALFVVDLGAAGVARAQVGEQLGLRGASAQALTFQGVSAQRLALADTTAAEVQARTLLNLGTAAVAVGTGYGALQAAASYAQQREQFGKPIATLQPIQWQVADAVTALDAAQLLVLRAAWQLDEGLRTADASAHMAQVRAGEAAVSAADKAIQIHGGYGYTREFPVERAYRDALLLAVLHGTAAGHKLAVSRALVAAL